MIVNFWVASNFNHNYWALAWYDIKCVIVSIVGWNYTISSATMKPMCFKSWWTIFHYVKTQLRTIDITALSCNLHSTKAYLMPTRNFWHFSGTIDIWILWKEKVPLSTSNHHPQYDTRYNLIQLGIYSRTISSSYQFWTLFLHTKPKSHKHHAKLLFQA
jgi:hypothetical protein